MDLRCTLYDMFYLGMAASDSSRHSSSLTPRLAWKPSLLIYDSSLQIVARKDDELTETMKNSKRTSRITIWTIAIALAGIFLCSKGAQPYREKLLALLMCTIVGSLIGFGFGHTFVQPRSTRERRLKVVFATATCGIIGAAVGAADSGIRAT